MEKKQKHEKYEEIDCHNSVLIACDKGDDDIQLEYYFE